MDTLCRKENWVQTLLPVYTTDSKRATDPNVKCKTIKVLEDGIGRDLNGQNKGADLN